MHLLIYDLVLLSHNKGKMIKSHKYCACFFYLLYMEVFERCSKTHSVLCNVVSPFSEGVCFSVKILKCRNLLRKFTTDFARIIYSR